MTNCVISLVPFQANNPPLLRGQRLLCSPEAALGETEAMRGLKSQALELLARGRPLVLQGADRLGVSGASHPKATFPIQQSLGNNRINFLTSQDTQSYRPELPSVTARTTTPQPQIQSRQGCPKTLIPLLTTFVEEASHLLSLKVASVWPADGITTVMRVNYH